MIEKYRELMRELLLEREAAPGGLSQETEARYAGELDQYFWDMSEEDQEKIEDELTRDLITKTDSNQS